MALKQKKLVGIEIGTQNVKMVMTNPAGKILKYTYSDIADGVISNGEVTSKAMLTEILKTTRKNLGVSFNKAALAISSPDIVIRYIYLPIMEDKYLDKSIKTEIAGLLPDDPSNYIIDYVLVDKIDDEEKKQMQLLVFAVPERVIKSYVECVRDAGFKVLYVDVIENAYEKLFKILKKRKQVNTSNFACIYIDNSRVSVSVYGNNKFFINKILENAMTNVFEEISLKTGNSPDEVRRQLYNEDILTHTEKYLIEKSVLEEYIKLISLEINRVIEYYRSRNIDSPLEAVYFTGGFTHIIGIQEFIGNFLGVPTFNASRFLEDMYKKPPKKNTGVDYTNAIAITLREDS